MMKVQWQKLFIKISVWLTAEILLNVIGLDNLADYSEFMVNNQAFSQVTHAFTNLITLVI